MLERRHSTQRMKRQDVVIAGYRPQLAGCRQVGGRPNVKTENVSDVEVEGPRAANPEGYYKPGSSDVCGTVGKCDAVNKPPQDQHGSPGVVGEHVPAAAVGNEAAAGGNEAAAGGNEAAAACEQPMADSRDGDDMFSGFSIDDYDVDVTEDDGRGIPSCPSATRMLVRWVTTVMTTWAPDIPSDMRAFLDKVDVVGAGISRLCSSGPYGKCVAEQMVRQYMFETPNAEGHSARLEAVAASLDLVIQRVVVLESVRVKVCQSGVPYAVSELVDASALLRAGGTVETMLVLLERGASKAAYAASIHVRSSSGVGAYREPTRGVVVNDQYSLICDGPRVVVQSRMDRDVWAIFRMEDVLRQVPREVLLCELSSRGRASAGAPHHMGAEYGKPRRPDVVRPREDLTIRQLVRAEMARRELARRQAVRRGLESAARFRGGLGGVGRGGGGRGGGFRGGVGRGGVGRDIGVHSGAINSSRLDAASLEAARMDAARLQAMRSAARQSASKLPAALPGNPSQEASRGWCGDRGFADSAVMESSMWFRTEIERSDVARWGDAGTSPESGDTDHDQTMTGCVE
jgi:hypothetical protein